MECWQSGNAPDSKSGEPSFPWRAGSNPVHSFFTQLEAAWYQAFNLLMLANDSKIMHN